jgi:flavin reductase (DIM6/NTAB) family NADH-FMN oxidoreductase RutF
MAVDDPQRSLAAALGRIPSGLFILTVSHAGQETGFLASWVQQCSFKPPRLSFAVQPDRPIVGLLVPEALLAFNILEASQTDMIAHFGKGFALGVNAFETIDVIREEGKPPVLTEAVAVLEGRVANRVSVGDHDLVIVDLHAGRLLTEGQPMIHVRKNGLHY